MCSRGLLPGLDPALAGGETDEETRGLPAVGNDGGAAGTDGALGIDGAVGGAGRDFAGNVGCGGEATVGGATGGDVGCGGEATVGEATVAFEAVVGADCGDPPSVVGGPPYVSVNLWKPCMTYKWRISGILVAYLWLAGGIRGELVAN